MALRRVLTLSSCMAFFIMIGLGAFCSADSSQLESIKKVTHVLKSGIEKFVDEPEDVKFQMFCRIGEKKYLSYYFRSATLRITSSAEDIKLIKGNNPKDVYLQYQERTWLLWIANVLPWRARDTSFPTFNTSCVGISTSRPYTAMVIIRPVDPWKIVTLIAGIALFFLAPDLSQSTIFFYSSGTALGALAAAIVILFIIQRFMPKGKFGWTIMSILYTISFYYAGETWKRLEELVHERLPYIVAYLFTGAFVAFLSCYRWGPPTHPKTLDILRWSLQVTGLVLIHFSSDFVEMSTVIILSVLAYNHVNSHLKYYVEGWYRRLFPQKRRLITEEEYITQGAIETEKGLLELRKFCSSPDSKPWKLVNKLRDPRRFSSFVEGTSHINDDEVLAYDYESEDCLMYQQRAALPTSNPAVNYSRSALQPQNNLDVTDDSDDDFPIRPNASLETTDDED